MSNLRLLSYVPSPEAGTAGRIQNSFLTAKNKDGRRDGRDASKSYYGRDYGPAGGESRSTEKGREISTHIIRKKKKMERIGTTNPQGGAKKLRSWGRGNEQNKRELIRAGAREEKSRVG